MARRERAISAFSAIGQYHARQGARYDEHAGEALITSAGPGVRSL